MPFSTRFVLLRSWYIALLCKKKKSWTYLPFYIRTLFKVSFIVFFFFLKDTYNSIIITHWSRLWFTHPTIQCLIMIKHYIILFVFVQNWPREKKNFYKSIYDLEMAMPFFTNNFQLIQLFIPIQYHVFYSLENYV